MVTAAIPFPQIDPVLIHLGPFAIRWYAIAYIAGLLIGWWLVLVMLRQKSLWRNPPSTARRRRQRTRSAISWSGRRWASSWAGGWAG